MNKSLDDDLLISLVDDYVWSYDLFILVIAILGLDWRGKTLVGSDVQVCIEEV